MAPSLFEAAGLEKTAPRPLADRLRPKRLDEVIGQEHLIGPDGALTRMLESGRIGPPVLWGPPRTGKTTVARPPADAPVLRAELGALVARPGARLPPPRPRFVERAARPRRRGRGPAAAGHGRGPGRAAPARRRRRPGHFVARRGG